MGKIGNWINRQRHNRGYGVQSPSAFFFVTQVLKERLPYYAYPILEAIAKEEGYPSKRAKELFRIANHHAPANCIAIGSPTIACAMATAKTSVKTYCITKTTHGKKANDLLDKLGCKVLSGNTLKEFATVLNELKEIGILYIGNTPQRAELLDIALRYTNDSSLIVIDDIHSDDTTKRWWQTVVDNPKTIITYDLYSYGLLYFNKERIKQHYTLKK